SVSDRCVHWCGCYPNSLHCNARWTGKRRGSDGAEASVASRGGSGRNSDRDGRSTCQRGSIPRQRCLWRILRHPIPKQNTANRLRNATRIIVVGSGSSSHRSLDAGQSGEENLDLEALTSFFGVSAILLGIGIYGLATKRSAIRILFAVELIYNAANLNIIAFARLRNPPIVTGQVIVLFSIALAAMEAAVGLAIIIVAFRLNNEIDLRKLTRLRG